MATQDTPPPTDADLARMTDHELWVCERMGDWGEQVSHAWVLRLVAEIRELREAARPFVEWARVAAESLKDIPYRQDQGVVVVTVPFEVRITLGDLRRLAEAVGEEP